MLKASAAIVVAALIAGAITGFPQFVEPVSASTPVDVAVSPAPACPQRGWPYNHCGDSDGSNPSGFNGVRLVALDRLN